MEEGRDETALLFLPVSKYAPPGACWLLVTNFPQILWHNAVILHCSSASWEKIVAAGKGATAILPLQIAEMAP